MAQNRFGAVEAREGEEQKYADAGEAGPRGEGAPGAEEIREHQGPLHLTAGVEMETGSESNNSLSVVGSREQIQRLSGQRRSGTTSSHLSTQEQDASSSDANSDARSDAISEMSTQQRNSPIKEPSQQTSHAYAGLFQVKDVFDPNWDAPMLVGHAQRAIVADGIRDLCTSLCTSDGPCVRGECKCKCNSTNSAAAAASSDACISSMAWERYAMGAAVREAHRAQLYKATAEIETLVGGELGQRVWLTLFGSVVYGVFDGESDADVYVQLESTHEAAEAYALVHRVFLGAKIRDAGWTVKTAVNGKVPVFTVVNLEHYPNVEVDLGFGYPLGIEKSHLFKTLMASDPRVLPLLTHLKHEMRTRGLINSKDGLFSSYTILTMALSVLTDLEVIPRLREDYQDLNPRYVNGVNCAYREPVEGWVSENTSCIGHLLWKVLQGMRTPKIFCLSDPQVLCGIGRGEGEVKLSVVICDLDDTLQFTSKHVKNLGVSFLDASQSDTSILDASQSDSTSMLDASQSDSTSILDASQSEYLYRDPKSIPPKCIPEVVEHLNVMKSRGHYIIILTGRSMNLKPEIVAVLERERVPHDMVLCKDHGSFENTAKMKHEAVLGVAQDLHVEEMILMDDNVVHLEGMMSGARAAPSVHTFTPLLVSNGKWERYGGCQNAAIFLMASPQCHLHRAMMKAVCDEGGGVLVSADDMEGAHSRERWSNACAQLTYALAIEKRQFVFFSATMSAGKIKQVAAAVPPWVTLVVLQPFLKPVLPNATSLLKGPPSPNPSLLAVQLYFLMSRTHPEEVAYRSEVRTRGNGTTWSKGNCLTKEELLPGEGLDSLSVAQHMNIHGIFEHFVADTVRCLETEARLQGAGLPTEVHFIRLEYLWPRIQAPPDVIELVESVLRKPPSKNRQMSKAKQQALAQFLAELHAGEGFFALVDIDANAAKEELGRCVAAKVAQIHGSLRVHTPNLSCPAPA